MSLLLICNQVSAYPYLDPTKAELETRIDQILIEPLTSHLLLWAHQQQRKGNRSIAKFELFNQARCNGMLSRECLLYHYISSYQQRKEGVDSNILLPLYIVTNGGWGVLYCMTCALSYRTGGDTPSLFLQFFVAINGLGNIALFQMIDYNSGSLHEIRSQTLTKYLLEKLTDLYYRLLLEYLYISAKESKIHAEKVFLNKTATTPLSSLESIPLPIDDLLKLNEWEFLFNKVLFTAQFSQDAYSQNLQFSIERNLDGKTVISLIRPHIQYQLILERFSLSSIHRLLSIGQLESVMRRTE